MAATFQGHAKKKDHRQLNVHCSKNVALSHEILNVAQQISSVYPYVLLQTALSLAKHCKRGIANVTREN